MLNLPSILHEPLTDIHMSQEGQHQPEATTSSSSSSNSNEQWVPPTPFSFYNNSFGRIASTTTRNRTQTGQSKSRKRNRSEDSGGLDPSPPKRRRKQPNYNSDRWDTTPQSTARFKHPGPADSTPTLSGSSPNQQLAGEHPKSAFSSHGSRPLKLSDMEKTSLVFDKMHELKLPLGNMMTCTFGVKDSQGKKFTRPPRMAKGISRYLLGQSKHKVSTVLGGFLESSYGRKDRKDKDMYSTSKPYQEIASARPATTSFALQTVARALRREANAATSVGGGLHVSRRKNASRNVCTWESLRQGTVPRVTELLKKNQRLAWFLMEKVAAPEVRKGVSGQQLPPGPSRPIDGVIAHSLSMLDFKHNSHANMLPASRGVLALAQSVPSETLAYMSRVGEAPAYTTICKMMRDLSTQKKKEIRSLGRSPTRSVCMVVDNVQNQRCIYDHRIGRESDMVVGFGGTCIELDPHPESAFDVDDKLRRIALNQRSNLTVERVFSWINQKHFDVVIPLHWLEVLTRCVPKAGKYKANVQELFNTVAAIRKKPVKRTPVHPFAFNGYNETIPTEFKAGILDFLRQLGQTVGDHDRKMSLAGGDGSTFNQFLQMKMQLQLQDTEFERWDYLVPILEEWHTEWTNLSRLYGTHWGPPMSSNPATLSDSARVIGHKGPANLKKVDYFSASHLANLIMDARILDCWGLFLNTGELTTEEYFDQLPANEVPTFEDLYSMARDLHHSYTTLRAAEAALHDPSNPILDKIPMGSPWTNTSLQEATSVEAIIPTVKEQAAKRRAVKRAVLVDAGLAPAPRKNKTVAAPVPMVVNPDDDADYVLNQSMHCLKDLIVSKETACAVASGDVGRLYECLKIMLFTFSGSTHTNYSGYLLEFIVSLELESSPELKNVVLDSLLVNLSGEEGHFQAADNMEESINRCLEAIMERKGIEYGDPYVRDLLSRNLYEIMQLKREWRDGFNLRRKDGSHTDPHNNPERRRLLKRYKHVQLHSKRPHRNVDGRDVDDLSRGGEYLRKTKIKSMIGLESVSKGLLQKYDSESGGKFLPQDTSGFEEVPEDGDGSEDEDDGDRSVFGCASWVDGELRIEEFSIGDLIGSEDSMPDIEGDNDAGSMDSD